MFQALSLVLALLKSWTSLNPNSHQSCLSEFIQKGTYQNQSVLRWGKIEFEYRADGLKSDRLHSFPPPPSETIPHIVPSHPHTAFYLIKLLLLKFPRCKAHFPLTELFVWYLTKTDVHIFYFSVCRLFLFFTIGDTVWKL